MTIRPKTASLLHSQPRRALVEFICAGEPSHSRKKQHPAQDDTSVVHVLSRDWLKWRKKQEDTYIAVVHDSEDVGSNAGPAW